MAGLPPTSAQQTGGYIDEARSIISIMIPVALGLGIVFSKKIPDSVVAPIQTPLGNLMGMVAVVGIAVGLGILQAIIAAILLLLLLSKDVEPSKEGFAPDTPMRRVITDKHKWFSEIILNEDPYLIEEDTITTNAVQDLTEKGSGSVTNGGVQNGSVQSR